MPVRLQQMGDAPNRRAQKSQPDDHAKAAVLIPEQSYSIHP